MSRKIFLFLMIAILAAPAVYSQQTFQQAIFVHKTSREKQTFKKGQKLKVIFKNAAGDNINYKGKLTRINGDSIFIDVWSKEIGVPLARVVKIQEPGTSLFLWLGIIGGLMLLLLGLLLKLAEDTSNAIRSPLGLQETKSPHSEVIILGIGIIFLGLMLSFKPSVKYPDRDWKIQTEYAQPTGQTP